MDWKRAFQIRRGFLVGLGLLLLAGVVGYLVLLLGTQMKSTSANVTDKFSGEVDAGAAVQTEDGRVRTLEGGPAKMNMAQDDDPLPTARNSMVSNVGTADETVVSTDEEKSPDP